MTAWSDGLDLKRREDARVGARNRSIFVINLELLSSQTTGEQLSPISSTLLTSGESCVASRIQSIKS